MEVTKKELVDEIREFKNLLTEYPILIRNYKIKTVKEDQRKPKFFGLIKGREVSDTEALELWKKDCWVWKGDLMHNVILSYKDNIQSLERLLKLNPYLKDEDIIVLTAGEITALSSIQLMREEIPKLKNEGGFA